MSTVTLGLLVLLATVFISIFGLTMVRRRVSLSLLEQHRDVAGFIISVLGVVYGVLLGFIVVTVWEQYEGARASISGETNQMADLMQISQGFPDPISERIRQNLLSYGELVINAEWPLMSDGESSIEAQLAMDHLWKTYREIEPEDAHENALITEGLSRMSQLSDYRRARLHASQSELPDVVWVVLILGAMITIFYTYLFGVQRIIAQGIITAALSFEIALVLFLVFVLDNPFRGDFKLTSEPYKRTMQRIVEIGKL
ncbi:DUF4239 domain-containing protein [bacterium]|nr:DUF4239 domain-containing protein [bacterium]